jgi:hypothetical protein
LFLEGFTTNIILRVAISIIVIIIIMVVIKHY